MMKKNKFSDSPIFMKLLAFFLAMILWFFVAGERQDALGFEQINFSDIPLTYRNLQEDLTVVDIEENVTLSLQGSPQAFDGLTPADLEAYVDLSGKEEGRHEVRIQANAPPGLSVVRIDPPKTIVDLEDLFVRQISVEALFSGNPGDGMIVDELFFEPEEVFVRGPRLKVEEVERVGFHLDIEGAQNEIFKTMEVYPFNDSEEVIEGIELSPDSVEVMVHFDYPQREISINPVFSNNGEEVQNVFVEPQTVTVKGPQSLLDELQYIATQPIDLQGQEGEFSTDIPLELPEGMDFVSEETVNVRVILHEQD